MKEEKQENYVYEQVGKIGNIIEEAKKKLSDKYYSYFKEQLLDFLNEMDIR